MIGYSSLCLLGLVFACSDVPSNATNAANQVGGAGSSAAGSGGVKADSTAAGGQENPMAPSSPVPGTAGGSASAGSSANEAGAPLAGAGGNGMSLQNLASAHCFRPGCTAMWANDPCNAFDGRLDTVTGPAKTWDSALGTLAVDFGQTQNIAKVVVHYDDHEQPGVTFPSPGPGYTIEVSNDGKSWTTHREVANPSPVDTQEDLNASSRYVMLRFKLVFFDPWFVHSVREIELWGP